MRAVIGLIMLVIPIIAFVMLTISSFGANAMWFWLIVLAIIVWFAIAETLITS